MWKNIYTNFGYLIYNTFRYHIGISVQVCEHINDQIYDDDRSRSESKSGRNHALCELSLILFPEIAG